MLEIGNGGKNGEEAWDQEGGGAPLTWRGLERRIGLGMKPGVEIVRLRQGAIDRTNSSSVDFISVAY